MKRAVRILLVLLSVSPLAAVSIGRVALRYRESREMHSAAARHTLFHWGKFVSYERIGGVLRGDGSFSTAPKYMNFAWQRTHELPFGVVLGRSPRSDPRAVDYFRVVAPWWLLFAATALPPLANFALFTRARRRQRRRAARHLCETCGYDLRATNTRCPECGTATA
jgi:hypothetical protein